MVYTKDDGERIVTVEEHLIMLRREWLVTVHIGDTLIVRKPFKNKSQADMYASLCKSAPRIVTLQGLVTLEFAER